ncbi:MAG TPA: arsenic resistance N-acetyltransferase ArsN2 [Chitinophagaceae bacterium]|jgi:amino-acid N-acetyltransferase|nr:arsenic resistance N-acetyltransferase ArsN2 [Chitinophagaceae bacterium]
MTEEITISANGAPYAADIVRLLQQERLPVEDLPEGLPHFFAAFAGDEVVGAIGLERYADTGLLRSLVVDPAYRNRGIADYLIACLEGEAAALGLSSLYLLTTTAPEYFARKGFLPADRSTAPEALQRSSEFTHTCPQSAVLMKKELQPA